MLRTPCCDKESVKKGKWSAEEDAALKSYVDTNGANTNWLALPQKIGLNRCGKSCRLRWLNYLRPDIKRGKFTEDEDKIITDLDFSIGCRWSVMADKLPGRTDNDIKNYWITKLKRKIVGNQKKRPSTSQLHNLQEIVGCAAVNDGGDLKGVEQEQQSPITLSFSTNNVTTATCSCGGGGGGVVGANSNLSDLPRCNFIRDHQPMVDQFYFGNLTAITSSGGSGGSADPPMNTIIDEHPSMARQFRFHENGSSSSSYDLMTTLLDMHDTDIDMINMDISCNIDGGSTSTSREVLNASLKELQDLLFNDLPTPNTNATTCPVDFFPRHCEEVRSWDDDVPITSSFCLLPVDDCNNEVGLLDNANDCQDNFLWQDILDQFSS